MRIAYEVTVSGSMLPFGDTVLTAVLGYGVVFLGLLSLMVIVYCMGAIFKAKSRRVARVVEKPADGPKLPAAAPKVPEPKLAPGSAGEVKRFDVSDKEAAMIMAIVADQMGVPLNELRFKSIKEVK